MDAGEAEFGQIQFIGKGIDDANWVIRFHIVFETRRQKARLLSVSNFNETSHLARPKQCHIIA
ncbi:hypothetical protein WH91_12970 [Devosia psychrophila]|uniref:Uncharacterized protein n=1 Tax=Devosia psychrophila TaxID=728005 RepID=A0ABR5DXL0_9HYPH|nr:hypothetical protein WH91_12970 [Devosia psychrophila]